tara:strand:- start:7048 stop:7455 length:408 start_codon:yes stop_codon:yes gene_type:complete
MASIPGYEQLSILHVDEHIVVYRGWDGAGKSFILKHARADDPWGTSRQHFDRMRRIDTPGLCTPIKQIEHGAAPLLVYPDIGEQTIASQLDADRSLTESIDIALGISDALSVLHAEGVGAQPVESGSRRTESADR